MRYPNPSDIIFKEIDALLQFVAFECSQLQANTREAFIMQIHRRDYLLLMACRTWLNRSTPTFDEIDEFPNYFAQYLAHALSPEYVVKLNNTHINPQHRIILLEFPYHGPSRQFHKELMSSRVIRGLPDVDIARLHIYIILDLVRGVSIKVKKDISKQHQENLAMLILLLEILCESDEDIPPNPIPRLIESDLLRKYQIAITSNF